MTGTIVLLHSPLVGPGCWAPTARELESRGWTCLLPTAPPATAWHELVDVLVAGIGEAAGATVVGHSASNLLLPAIAARIEASPPIFVDGKIPSASGMIPPVEAEFLEFVRALPADDGLLPRWSDWWGAGGLRRLFPDDATYEAFEAELPRLHLDWFDDAIDSPPWDHLAAAYIQTSAVAAEWAADARKRGWPVAGVDGTHLHPLLEPGEMAEAIEDVLALLDG